MLRCLRTRSLLTVLAAITLAGLVPPTEVRADNSVKKVIEKLNQPIDLDKGIDRNTPLKDALEFLSGRHDLTIIVDEQAFRQGQGDDIPNVAESPVQLQKVRGVRLGTVLRLIVSQVQGAYLVENGHVLILPQKQVLRQVWAGRPGPHLPLVSVVFEHRPLHQALEELSDMTGISVVISGPTDKKSQTEVNATLRNVPLDTAVRVLADMADLKAVQLDNLLYVTTRENARTLQAEQEQRMLKRVDPRKEDRGKTEMPKAKETPGPGAKPVAGTVPGR